MKYLIKILKELPKYYNFFLSGLQIRGIGGISINDISYKKYLDFLIDFRRELLQKMSLFINLSRDVEIYSLGGFLRKYFLLVYPGQKFEYNPLRDEIIVAVKLANGRIIWSVSPEDLYGDKNILHPDNPLSEAFRYYEPRISRKGSYFIITKFDDLSRKYGQALPPDALETIISLRRKAFGMVTEKSNVLKIIKDILKMEIKKMNSNYGLQTNLSEVLLRYVLRIVGKPQGNISEWIGRVRDLYILSHFSYVFSGKLPFMMLETSAFEGNPKKFRKKIRKIEGGKLYDL